jgi:uroporphyrinogen-III synthase
MSVTFTPKVLWVTQTQPIASRTVRRLIELGFFAFAGPLLRERPSSSEFWSEKRTVLQFIAQLRNAISYLSRVDGILVSSSGAARRLARILEKHSWHGTIFCISEDCVDELRRVDDVEILIAPAPDDDSLINLVRTAALRSR